MLKIFNTLTGRKDSFEPLVPKTVRMYVCGVTVYDYCHLGHARSAFVFDVIRRYLEHIGFTVEFVKNFTDVDDKIIKRANEQHKKWQEVTATYIDAYYEDMARLGISRAWREPKATEHMADIIKLVETLIQKGTAYQVNGDVYFQVEKYAPYGRLSKRKLDDLLAGARVEVDERKKHPMDFALWKAAKPDEPYWESPWGRGRPGWHIECSAMSMKHLGETFDIHGGGMDLIFPHHENEIAQSCAATGKEFARYWVHNGFVQINQEKMSKSLGNFFTVREIFEKWNMQWRTQDESKRDRLTAEVLRYFLLTTHYRSPVDFSDQGLQEAKRALDGFYGLFQRLDEIAQSEGPGDSQLQQVLERRSAGFREAMDDDFNTPAAIAQFQDLRGEVNRLLGTGLSKKACGMVQQLFRSLGGVFGLLLLSWKDWEFRYLEEPSDWPPPWMRPQDLPRVPQPPIADEDLPISTLSDKEIKEKIDERNEARRRKDFKRADEIRAELTSFGITLEDRPDGTTRWKR